MDDYQDEMLGLIGYKLDYYPSSFFAKKRQIILNIKKSFIDLRYTNSAFNLNHVSMKKPIYF